MFLGGVPLQNYPRTRFASDVLTAFGFDSGSSVHTSAAGALHGGAGGKFGSDPYMFDVIPKKQSPSPSKPKTSGGSVPSASGDSAKALDYLNADLAKYYGMSPETAYNEALSNTAYQRAVKDMQAAGLNPAVLFGAGRASAADGVNYIHSASGGSGGSGRGYSSGKGKSGYLFSQGAYGAISAAAGLVGMVFSKNPTGFWIGSQTAKGIMGALNSLSK